MPVIKLDAVQVLGLACLGWLIGLGIKRAFPALDRLNIPASITGGLVFALLSAALHDRVVNFDPNLLLRDILMVAFFTTVGMGASVRLLKVGGVQVAIFFAIAAVGALLQNLVGIAAASAFGLHPLVGILAGSVALTGGPATALAFGGSFEQWGIAGAPAIGLAAAMFGIVAGGLIGGPVGGSLIMGQKLAPRGKARSAEGIAYPEDAALTVGGPMQDESASEYTPLTQTVILIAIAMGLGAVITSFLDPWLKSHGFALPAYIGAMIAASLIRNLADATGWFSVSQHTVDAVGEIALNIFIVMALMTLQLWALVSLALPLIAILVIQAVLVVLMARWMVHRIMGRDYDSAVMAGGFCGFMMGTTANALACMGVLTEKFGPAPRAYLVVPLVGAFLIDFANALLITTMANFLR